MERLFLTFIAWLLRLVLRTLLAFVLTVLPIVLRLIWRIVRTPRGALATLIVVLWLLSDHDWIATTISIAELVFLTQLDRVKWALTNRL